MKVQLFLADIDILIPLFDVYYVFFFNGSQLVYANLLVHK